MYCVSKLPTICRNISIYFLKIFRKDLFLIKSEMFLQQLQEKVMILTFFPVLIFMITLKINLIQYTNKVLNNHMEANKQIDLGGFTLYDSTPIPNDPNTLQETLTQRLVENIHFAFEAAVNAKKQEILAIQMLPQEQQIHDFEQSKLYFKLPEVSTMFPRSKRVPEKKIPTKWQKFAKEKGIHKRKRAGMQYDSGVKTQVARWGKKSKKNMFQPAIMEEKQHGRNPFQDEKKNKKLVRQQQKLKQIKNKEFREKNKK